jgi:hypothetical protein
MIFVAWMMADPRGSAGQGRQSGIWARSDKGWGSDNRGIDIGRRRRSVLSQRHPANTGER